VEIAVGGLNRAGSISAIAAARERVEYGEGAAGGDLENTTIAVGDPSRTYAHAAASGSVEIAVAGLHHAARPGPVIQIRERIQGGQCAICRDLENRAKV